jgi:Na+-transporting NADH:ubiquinone oxidoreductase subunit C
VKRSLYTVVFAAALGTVCALLLTGVGQFVAPYREANAKAEKVRHVLHVLGVPLVPGTPPQELLEVFERDVRTEERGELTVYIYGEAGGADPAVAIPLVGPGLWGPIKGFLALKPDMRTIRGVTFYEHEETPGLGGEIASAWFQDQFKGKSIVGPDGEPGIRILRGGGASQPNEVDAITGATMTSKKVEAMLNAAVMRIVEERRDYEL